jgi:NAD(P)-dependent dehydrogenase (short-subunit alcohol dehydrogenase family)
VAGFLFGYPPNHNARALGPGPQPALLAYPLESLVDVYKTNVVAPLGLLQAVQSHLKPGARIIDVTSAAGIEAA